MVLDAQLHFILEIIARAEHLVRTKAMNDILVADLGFETEASYYVTGPDGKESSVLSWKSILHDRTYPCCFWEAGNSLTLQSSFFVQWYPHSFYQEYRFEKCEYLQKWTSVLTAIAQRINCTGTITPRIAYIKLSNAIKTIHNATNDAIFSAISIYKINDTTRKPSSSFIYYPTFNLGGRRSRMKSHLFLCDIWEIPTICGMKVYALPPLPKVNVSDNW